MTDRVTSPTLKRVSKGQLCSGCGACEAIAPGKVQMAVSADGFLRPIQKEPISPQQEERISDVCPGLRMTLKAGDRHDDPLWGPYVGIFTGHSTDPALRHTASSGGALSALLVHLLDTGKVDRILQVAADPALPFGNTVVLNDSQEGILNSAGSRYAPSAPLAGLDAILDGRDRLAFVGKPCDVAALRALARFDPRVNERIVVMLSFFCAGVPSLDGAREVLEELGVKEAEVQRFRYRGDGWPGYATATLQDGQTARMSYADSWGNILSRHLQFRCKICPDGIGSFADVVCADAWEADANGYPIFTEREGTSLVMSRTEAGAALVNDAVTADRLAITPFDIETLSGIQPGQTRKRRFVLSRLVALFVAGRPVPAFRGFHLSRNALRAGVTRTARNFLGTLMRIAAGRL